MAIYTPTVLFTLEQLDQSSTKQNKSNYKPWTKYKVQYEWKWVSRFDRLFPKVMQLHRNVFFPFFFFFLLLYFSDGTLFQSTVHTQVYTGRIGITSVVVTMLEDSECNFAMRSLTHRGRMNARFWWTPSLLTKMKQEVVPGKHDHHHQHTGCLLFQVRQKVIVVSFHFSAGKSKTGTHHLHWHERTSPCIPNNTNPFFFMPAIIFLFMDRNKYLK